MTTTNIHEDLTILQTRISELWRESAYWFRDIVTVSWGGEQGLKIKSGGQLSIMKQSILLGTMLASFFYAGCKDKIVQVEVPVGSLNYAAVFDGQTTFIEIPASLSQQPAQITVELDAWLDTVTAGSFPFLSEANLDQWNSASGFSVKYEENQIHWKLATASNLANAFRPVDTLQAGRWYHIACTYDGSVGRIYVDTTLIYEDARTFSIYYGGSGFWLGRAINSLYGGNVFFKGRLDEIRVWNFARTKAQILSTMSTSLQGNEAGLIGYWNFDPSPDHFDPAEDRSPSHVEGRLNGNFRFVQSSALN